MECLAGGYGAFCLLLAGKFYFVGCVGSLVISGSLLGFLWAFGWDLLLIGFTQVSRPTLFFCLFLVFFGCALSGFALLFCPFVSLPIIFWAFFWVLFFGRGLLKKLFCVDSWGNRRDFLCVGEWCKNAKNRQKWAFFGGWFAFGRGIMGIAKNA